MPGYEAFRPKPQTTGGAIADGSIELRHLAPAVFVELRRIALHTHTGVRSARINLRDLTGSFTKDGFIMYSSDGSKRYRIQVNNSGVLTATELT